MEIATCHLTPFDPNASVKRPDLEMRSKRGLEGMERSAPEIACEAPMPPTPSSLPQNIQNLISMVSNWGSSDAECDINGDGTVNIQDFLMQLSTLNSPAGAETPDAQEQPLAADSASEAAATSPDANALATQPSAINDVQPLAVATPIASVEPAQADQSPRAQRVGKLKRALIERLDAAGFTHRPPTNIRELVGKLDLGAVERQDLLSHVAKRYPMGLGVNLRA